MTPMAPLDPPLNSIGGIFIVAGALGHRSLLYRVTPKCTEYIYDGILPTDILDKHNGVVNTIALYTARLMAIDKQL